MKEVDKQWDKKGCNSIDECERIGDCRDCKNVWKAGFKTALEWVESRLEFGSKVAYSTDDILMAIKKEIREELEN